MAPLCQAVENSSRWAVTVSHVTGRVISVRARIVHLSSKYPFYSPSSILISCRSIMMSRTHLSFESRDEQEIVIKSLVACSFHLGLALISPTLSAAPAPMTRWICWSSASTLCDDRDVVKLMNHSTGLHLRHRLGIDEHLV